MINTYNESPLHHTLKTMYALEYNGKTEVPLEGFICDIISEEGEIIEIQTANVSKLKEKCSLLLQSGRKVKIVHPVIHQKIIELFSSDGKLLSKRKSPKSDTIYAICRQLTGIYPLLTHPNFTLEIIFVNIKEIRRKTEERTQLQNKSRRFLKDWVPVGKRLETVNSKRVFKTKKDYQQLLPQELEKEFTIPELQKAIFNLENLSQLSQANKKRASQESRLLIWLLSKMEIVVKTGKKGRSKLYSLI